MVSNPATFDDAPARARRKPASHSRAFLVSESGNQRPPVVGARSVNPRHRDIAWCPMTIYGQLRPPLFWRLNRLGWHALLIPKSHVRVVPGVKLKHQGWGTPPGGKDAA